MEFKSSQLSFTSLAQQAALASYQTPIPIVNEAVSRVASLLLSPAAALDFIFHTAALPLSFVYAIGKSVVQWDLNLTLPWQHLQRVREAVFPILFGSAAGLIHPYAGIYMTEPRDKHIAGGILLSNSKSQNDVTISPVSAFKEVEEIIRSNPINVKFPKSYRKMVSSLATWEKPLEMVQAIEMFDFKIAANGMSAIYQRIDETLNTQNQRAMFKRIALVAYPIFAALDITISIASSLFLFSVGVIQLTGAKCPAYLETTSSPVLHVYNIARIIVGIFSACIGFGISLIDPEKGIDYSFPSSSKFKMVKALIYPIFKRAEREIGALKNGERLVLPIVTQNGESREREILPSRNSHMTYLLIERKDDLYSAELIERGNHHGIVKDIQKKEASKIAKQCLSLRYSSSSRPKELYIRDTFFKDSDLVDLGTQGSISNCVITNLFAVFDVLNARDEGDDLEHKWSTRLFRAISTDRFDYYRYDFFPFAPMKEIISEIEALKDEKI